MRLPAVEALARPVGDMVAGCVKLLLACGFVVEEVDA